MEQLYLCTCDVITLFYICLFGSHINTLFRMKCRETCSVLRVDRCARKSAHLRNRVIEQICRQEVTLNMEVDPKRHKKES